MKQYSRLTQSNDIVRVRRLGKSNAHPLFVLIILRNESTKFNRIAVVAGKAVGGAVQRNKAKRKLKAALQQVYPNFSPGFDIILVARKKILDVSFQELLTALVVVSRKTGLVQREDVRF